MNPEWMANIKAPDPETIVDRLNGIYPSAIGPYKASPLEKEAANEIVRLRAGILAMIEWSDSGKMDSPHWHADRIRKLLPIKNAPEGGA